MKKKIRSVKLSYLGNSCILITCADGTRIVSDPFGEEHPAGLSDLPGNLSADAVTVSHIHADHNNVAAVSGNPQIITEPGFYQVGTIKVTGYLGWEGSPHGPNHEMRNVIFMFEVEGVKIIQLGDSAVVTDPETLLAIEKADIVVVNIDGYVIAHEEVLPFMKKIKARTVLLAHYSLAGQEVWCGAPTAEEFIAAFASSAKVLRADNEIEVIPGMPEQIAVLKPLMLLEK